MKKKIFFIIASFSKGGGAEALLTTIVNNLNPEKYEIGIMEITHSDKKIEPVNENIKIFPYYVEDWDPERKDKMYYVYHEWDRVIAEYIPQDYDLYVSFNCLKPSFLLPKMKKCIAWIHSDIYNLGSEKLQEERQLQDEAFEKADVIVSISDITTQSLKELFPKHVDKIREIYNGLDIERVREKAGEPQKEVLKHPAILSIGRLEERKNPLRLLDIFEKVHQKIENAHLYYMGYGELENAVIDAAGSKGLLQQIHMLGYYDNPFPVIAQCDVIGMFSTSEGFPMSLLEGVALNKPFVSSVIGGAEILSNGQKCGRVVETDDEAVNAIIGFLNADENIIQKECSESIKRFELRTYIQKVEELFDGVLDRVDY